MFNLLHYLNSLLFPTKKKSPKEHINIQLSKNQFINFHFNELVNF